MMFHKEFIPKILSGEKTQTRRLVKDGEHYGRAAHDFQMHDQCLIFDYVFTILKTKKYKQKVKWHAGNEWHGPSYAVCPGRGKPTAFYCEKPSYNINWKKVKKEYKTVSFIETQKYIIALRQRKNARLPDYNWKELRIRIKAIRREKLLDFKESDAIAEGFEDGWMFIAGFLRINYDSIPMKIKKLSKSKLEPKMTNLFWADIARDWNPEVWMLEFCVDEGMK